MGQFKRELGDGKRSRARFSKTEGLTSRVIPGLANNALPDIEVDKISNQVLKEFMPIFKERLRGNIAEQHIGHEGDLDDSFRTSVTGKTGSLRFNFYGRFVDMGVGKGVTLAELQSGRQVTDDRKGLTSRRRAKVWFSKQYVYERRRLTELMTQRMQELAVAVATNLPDEIPLNL